MSSGSGNGKTLLVLLCACQRLFQKEKLQKSTHDDAVRFVEEQIDHYENGDFSKVYALTMDIITQTAYHRQQMIKYSSTRGGQKWRYGTKRAGKRCPNGFRGITEASTACGIRAGVAVRGGTRRSRNNPVRCRPV